MARRPRRTWSRRARYSPRWTCAFGWNKLMRSSRSQCDRPASECAQLCLGPRERERPPHRPSAILFRQGASRSLRPDGPDFDRAVGPGRDFLGPLDGFVLRVALDDVEATDALMDLWPV